MKKQKVFILMLFMFGFFSNLVYSQINSNEKLSKFSNEIVDGKIYIASDQLIISNKMYLLMEDGDGILTKVLISQINSDENGLFVFVENITTPIAGWCRFGHKACDYCGRCSFPGCPTRPCECD